MTTTVKTKTIILNVGYCPSCRQGAKEGDIYDDDKRYNCNTCGYYQSYNNEMLEVDIKTNKITFSTVTGQNNDTTQ